MTTKDNIIVGLFMEYKEGNAPREVVWIGTGIDNNSYCISLEEAKKLAENITKLLQEVENRK
jgi:hypothetical protein